MKYIYLNDTGKRQGIHSASNLGKHYLEPAESIVVEIPEGTVPWIKVWHSSVLLSFVEKAVLTSLEVPREEPT